MGQRTGHAIFCTVIITFFCATVIVIGAPARGQEASHPVVRIASDSWPRYSLPDATGLFWDLMRLVFEPVGLAVEPVIAPYPRTVTMVGTGEADLWLAAYDGETDWAIFPRFPMGGDQMVAVMPAHRVADWAGEVSLRDAKVGFMRGYSFDRYVDVPMRVTELSGRRQGLRLVQRGRLAVFLDGSYLAEAAIEAAAGAFDDLRVLPLKWMPMVPGITDTLWGLYLARLYDCQMARLFADDVLRMLHRRWEIPYRYFAAGVTVQLARVPAPDPHHCLDELWQVYPDGPPAR